MRKQKLKRKRKKKQDDERPKKKGNQAKRKGITCSFGENCKFWKYDDCRYEHSSKYEETDPPEEVKVKEKNQTVHQQKKQCRYGKRCDRIKICAFEHTCRKPECKIDGCKYQHGMDEEAEQNKNKNEKKEGNVMDKKNIKCKFVKNCRNGEDCEYLHPNEKSPKEKSSKNGRREMQDVLHFLRNEMMKMRQDMKKMMEQREEDRVNMKKVREEMEEVKGGRKRK